MPSASPTAAARVAARVLPRPASSCAVAAARNDGPPSGPAAKRPAQRASSTVGAIWRRRDAPPVPKTDAGGGRGGRRDFAHLADARGPPMAFPSASHAARQAAPQPALDMPPAAPPVSACAAAGLHSPAHRGADAAPSWRGSAPRPSERAPSAGNDMPDGAREANVWIAERMPGVPHAVPAAHIVPMPARRSVTW